MEPSKEPISVRIGRINAQILGKLQVSKESVCLLTREALLDVLQILFDECNADYLKAIDTNVRDFVEKNRNTSRELKQLRVNLSDFEVKNVIGRGHYGEVHLVKEKQTADVYAMKTIKKHQSLEQKNGSFEVERNIMAFSNSHWLTSLQYAFQDSMNLYFVMEYHPGGDLLGLLYRHGGTLSESACSFYIAELVLGLNDLHNMGFVHRDIKPDNILLDRCGHLKIVDFGSAAKLNSQGTMTNILPVGTPDYIAPELLQSLDNKNKKFTYGVSCDYWSLGVLAYELTIGNTPFNGQNTKSVYSKIMNYKNTLKFPPDVVLSQAYVSLIKGLLTDQNTRLTYKDIIKHPLYENVDFNGLREQVPPYVPKIVSVDDTSNFTDVQRKKNEPHIDSFKTKTQFSGKNLPFIGFTYTPSQQNDDRESYVPNVSKNEAVQNLKQEIDTLQRKLLKTEVSFHEKDNLERKLEEKTRKLESIENLRDRLERDLANSIAECSGLKRRLDLERKDRNELEQKALELIKSAKLKWETSERIKLDVLNKQVDEFREKMLQLQNENASLKMQLEHAAVLENKHKVSLEKVENLSRKSVIGLESRLEKVTSETQNHISILQTKLNAQVNEKMQVERQNEEFRNKEKCLKMELQEATKKFVDLQHQFEQTQKIIKDKEDVICRLKDEKVIVKEHKQCIEQLKKEIDVLKSKAKEDKVANDLKKEKGICQQLTQEIEDLKTELEFEKLSHQTILEDLTKKHKVDIAELAAKIKLTVNQNNELEIKLKEADLNEENNQTKVKALEGLLVKLESGVSKLETSSERESVLQEQVKRLEQQLGQVHETLALEKQELSQFKSKYWRMEKDLQNADLDRKIVERDLKDLKRQNAQLTDDVKSMSEKMSTSRKRHENALLELNGFNENLTSDVYKLKDVINNLEQKLHNENEKFNNEKNYIIKLNDEINSKEMKMCSLIKDVEAYKSQMADVEKQIVAYEKNNNNLVVRLEAVLKEKGDLQGEIESYKREQQNHQLNRKALRDTCTVLEHQLQAYDDLYTASESEKDSLKNVIDKLTNELLLAKQDLLEARRFANEEKSLKLVADTKHKRLQEDFDHLQNECESYKSQCAEFKTYSNDLTDDLTLAERKITDLEISLKSSERQIENFVSENNVLKEENSSQLTYLNNTKETNYKLNQNLNEFKTKTHMLQQQVNVLENLLSEKVCYYKERELKSEATIQQQTKLIDYLQLKIEENNKKKKTLSDKLFGHSKKENQPPVAVVLNYKDLETQLRKEKEVTKNLRQEIVKLKSELYASPDAGITKSPTLNLNDQKKVFEQLVQSPASQKNDLYRQNSIQRMHHNIPHRFESKLCTKSTKCSNCSNQILLGRNSSVCRECLVVVHPNCVSALPRTCGLPRGYAQHYSESLSKSENSKNVSKCGVGNEDVIDVEGWVKIPVKGAWEKYYACLSLSALCIYKEPPNQPNVELVDSLDFKTLESHGKVILEPSGSDIDVPVANSDLPFVMKVEVSPNTTCWPPKCLLFMTLSIDDKEKWYKALQSTFTGSAGKYRGERILCLVDEFEVNCLVELNESVQLLGTEKGLYSCSNGALLHIAGLLCVHQLLLLPAVNLALMIADDNRVLISCDLQHLTSLTQCASCAEPSLMFKAVNVRNLSGFHIFEASAFMDRPTICVATARQLVIMSYDYSSKEFFIERILDTAEPTSCILFTNHTLIIGADKFFEIDLRTYSAGEFLDDCDANLSHVIKCYKMKSFPLAILRVSKSPAEYLLCFNEFATFVDEFGRSTRSCDIKWTHLPHAFYYCKNYLYVCQFCAVEILKLSAQTCSDCVSESSALVNVDGFKIELDSLQYLGCSKSGVYVKTGKEIKLISSSGLETNDVSLSSERTEHCEDNEDDDNFSFTSSIVRSLDGGSLSDGESISNEFGTHKHVKFACITDL